MKSLNKIVAIGIISIAFTLLVSFDSFATTGTITGETVNLRSSNSTSSKILIQLDMNEKVEVIKEEGDWYKVKYNSITGYISKSLLKIEGETEEDNSTSQEDQEETISEEELQTSTEDATLAEETSASQDTNQSSNTEQSSENSDQESVQLEIELGKTYNISEKINLKIIPLMNAIKNVEIEANSQITIVDSMNNWYYVQTENNSGWVRKAILENTIKQIDDSQSQENNEDNQTEETDTDEQTSEDNTVTTSESNDQTQNDEITFTEYDSSKTGYISSTTVNFREEASTSSTVIKKLTKNTEITILGETSDGWYKVEVDGNTGYVSATYVSEEKVPETSSRSMSDSEIATTSIENEPETNTDAQDNATVDTAESQDDTSASSTRGNTDTQSDSSSSSTGDEIVAYAKTFLGTKYVYGGSSPTSGFDCSGFTKYVYGYFGITLSRTSSAQASNGVAVSKDELEIGDLLIFNGSSNTSVGHVGIYIGNNQFIHASNPSGGVKITSLSESYYVKRYVGARRVF